MANIRKPVYLLAGGRSSIRTAPDPLMQAVFKESGTTAPTVAYVGVASGDDAGFFQRIAAIIKENGAAGISRVLIYAPKADLLKAKDMLTAADIIFISGGDVEEGMRVLRERKMDDFLSGLYQQGKLFFGLSAGSIMLAREWVLWRDPDDDATAELFPCLGLAPVICDTHDEEGGWQELQAALGLEQDDTRGYGIASGTGLRVAPDGRVKALGGAVHQYIKRHGSVSREADILPASR